LEAQAMTLQVTNLVKHFEGVQAVKGVSFEVKAGECVALIGPNGAGKSTCFACIAGQHELTSGEVFWNSQRINTWPAARRLKAGVARTFQVAQTFEALTVLQNVQLAALATRGLSSYLALDLMEIEAATVLLAQVGLAHLAQADVINLPYGAKKRLELAIALAGISMPPATVRPEPPVPILIEGAKGVSGAGPSPKLLLLDEPAAGLAEAERADLMALVKSLAKQGIAVLYTEHNMDAVFGVADRVLVLIDGQIAAQGSPAAIAQNSEVRSRYLGLSFKPGASARPGSDSHA
jgi:branched-chain amino acid transport system ATP-binding protein